MGKKSKSPQEYKQPPRVNVKLPITPDEWAIIHARFVANSIKVGPKALECLMSVYHGLPANSTELAETTTKGSAS